MSQFLLFFPVLLAKIACCSSTALGERCRCAAWEQNSSDIHGEPLQVNASAETPWCRNLGKECKTWAPDAMWYILGDLGHPQGIVSSHSALPENSCSGRNHWRCSRQENSRSHWTYMFRQLYLVPKLRSHSTLWIASFPYWDNNISYWDDLSTGLKWCFWMEAMIKIQIYLLWKMW